MTRLATACLVCIAVAGVAAPVLATYAPDAQLDIVALKNAPPSRTHWMGTDPYSRDIFSRLLFGARTSLAIASSATVISVALGACWGAVAFGARRIGGAWLLTFADAIRAIPRLLLLLCASSIVGSWSPLTLAAVVGVSASPAVCRIVYAQLVAVSALPFIDAARALGVSPARRLTHHLAPHLLSPLAAIGGLLFADVIVLEGSLSFLGLGISSPHVSWGHMVQDALPFLESAWWVAASPCVCLLVTVVCASNVVDAAPQLRRAV